MSRRKARAGGVRGPAIGVTTSPAEVHPGPATSAVRAWRAWGLHWSAVAFVASSLLTLPYGAPMPQWYTWTETALGAAFLLLLASDPDRRWRHVIYWPVIAIVGAWTLSIAGCAFPREVTERSIGMAGYSVVFVAIQVAMWRSDTLRAVRWTMCGVLLIITVDVCWQRWDTYSLIREVRGGELHRQFTGFVPFAGSQGNPNDLAVVGVLLPLAVPSASSWASIGIIAIVSAATSATWIISASRQTFLAWALSVSGLLGARASWRTRSAVVGVLAALSITVVLAVPTLRSRFAGVFDNPLGDRGMPMVYALKLFTDAPLFGVGPSLFGHYWVAGVRDGWQWAGQSLPAVGMPWVHCVPFEILCEWGLAGAAAFVAVLFTGARRLRMSMNAGAPARDLAMAVGIALASAAVISLIDVTFIKNWVRVSFWLLLGLCFGMPRALSAEVSRIVHVAKDNARPLVASRVVSRAGQI
jgi:hypothetical protein